MNIVITNEQAITGGGGKGTRNIEIRETEAEREGGQTFDVEILWKRVDGEKVGGGEAVYVEGKTEAERGRIKK